MLTHAHKVEHLVVSTFVKKGEEDAKSRECFLLRNTH